MGEFAALPFRPERYSDWLHVVCTTCYAYTIGDFDFAALQKNVYPEPGALAGRQIPKINFDDTKYEQQDPIVKYPGSDRPSARRWEIYADEIIGCLTADDVQFTGNQLKTDLEGYPGALFIVAQQNYRGDFHFCRMNPDGTFSDMTPERPPQLVKIGGKVATQFDHDSTIPSTRRNPYIFAGYIYVPRTLSCPVENSELKKAAEANSLLQYSSCNTVRADNLLGEMAPHRKAILERSFNGRTIVPMA